MNKINTRAQMFSVFMLFNNYSDGDLCSAAFVFRTVIVYSTAVINEAVERHAMSYALNQIETCFKCLFPV